MIKNILVTIITPCFNSEKTIGRTINSVLSQTYSNIEYIVIDAQSTDNTLKIIKEHEIKFNGRLRLISESDNGVYDAMNKGIRLANGKLIGIINSDDWYEEEAVEAAVKFFYENSFQVIYGMLRMYKQSKELGVFIKHHQFLEEQMILHPACFISKNIYDIYGDYNTKYKSSADYDFMLRLRNEKKIDFVPIYKLIANFAVGGISSSFVGILETAKIKYNNKIIGKIQFYRIMIEVFLAKIYRNILKNK